MSIAIPRGITAIKKTYGWPTNPGWYDNNIVSVELPYPMRYAADHNQRILTARFHRAKADHMVAALAEVWEHVRVEVKKVVGFDLTSERYDILTWEMIQAAGLDLWGGTYENRPMRGSTKLSTHALGIAFDIDPKRNRLGTQGRMQPWVIEIFRRWGFVWGGTFARNDPMHFQACSGY